MTTTPSSSLPTGPLVDVRDLNVSFRGRNGVTPVVRNVSFSLEAGTSLALVGESGSGKSVTARSLIGLAGANALTTASALTVRGNDVLGLSGAKLRRMRGADVGFVLQDALVSLDPLRPIGR
jgi:peptide/nickel transport system ATP-binding protein